VQIVFQNSAKVEDMKDRLLYPRVVFLLVLLLLMGGVASCSSERDSRLNVWIDSPRDSANVPVGEPVVVLSHAYAREGIAEVMLYVDSVPFSRAFPGESGADFSEFQHEWVPTEEGDYALQLWVYDALGEAGGPATVNIHVGDITVVEFVDTETPTPVLTSTFTVTPTPVISITPTLPPPTNTPTPTPTLVPADTTAPPVPTPVVPADGLVLSCRATQVLNWTPVSDPSGINGYYVHLQYESTADNWVTVDTWGPLSDKQVEVPVNCGGIYRWQVRVQDGVGNMSNWSTFFYFSVDLT
jgi:hypothetical protein